MPSESDANTSPQASPTCKVFMKASALLRCCTTETGVILCAYRLEIDWLETQAYAVMAVSISPREFGNTVPLLCFAQASAESLAPKPHPPFLSMG